MILYFFIALSDLKIKRLHANTLCINYLFTW